MTLRKFIFWPHLVLGLLAGLVIGTMCVTGVVAAFEDELVRWTDSDRRTVATSGADSVRLGVDELAKQVTQANPGKRLSGITLSSSSTEAVVIHLGREDGAYVNPYTGEQVAFGNRKLRAFFHGVIDWHRWLGREGTQRPVGKAITGVSNLVFLFLAVSGLYLWWPRAWSRAALRSTLWFRRGLKGKPRDFNWHNVIGFWCLPVLVVLTVSGAVISYGWASNLVYRLYGETPPPPRNSRSGQAMDLVLPPTEGASPLPLQTVFDSVAASSGAWKTISLRLGEGSGVSALAFSIKPLDPWPLFRTDQLTVDPFTARVLKADTYEKAKPGRRTRLWLRFLHTGEALGLFGKVLVALSAMGGTLLVWTGFALSWRRFVGRRRGVAPATAARPSVITPAQPKPASLGGERSESAEASSSGVGRRTRSAP